MRISLLEPAEVASRVPVRDIQVVRGVHCECGNTVSAEDGPISLGVAPLGPAVIGHIQVAVRIHREGIRGRDLAQTHPFHGDERPVPLRIPPLEPAHLVRRGRIRHIQVARGIDRQGGRDIDLAGSVPVRRHEEPVPLAIPLLDPPVLIVAAGHIRDVQVTRWIDRQRRRIADLAGVWAMRGEQRPMSLESRIWIRPPCELSAT